MLVSMLDHCHQQHNSNPQPTMTNGLENWLHDSSSMTSGSQSHNTFIMVIQHLLFSIWLIILSLYLIVLALWFARKIRRSKLLRSIPTTNHCKDMFNNTSMNPNMTCNSSFVNTNDTTMRMSSSPSTTTRDSSFKQQQQPTTQENSETILCYLHPDFYTTPTSSNEKIGRFSAQFSIAFNVVTKDNKSNKYLEGLFTQTHADHLDDVLTFDTHTPRNESSYFIPSHTCRTSTSRFCMACLRDVLQRYRFPYFLPHAV
ncbi:hypothetical protein C9374_008321 [Naegleria lovaniensis]|uniref:Uncharacterized protein n=1 Tax=Naegleria lovaniensis TaxID=51637 RepID=A0AA88KHU0_NAELO|nr:uncharacterized protein C9374_008321 [Naegleria lovaniensis]KAG2378178.1 hypothetical protein C9374_008321 [Naegleria lovaniensis]